MFLAGLYFSKNSVTTSRLRTLCIYGLGVEIRKIHCGFSDSLGLTWLSSSLFLVRLVILNFVRFLLGEFRDDVLVGVVAVFILDTILLCLFSVEHLVGAECTYSFVYSVFVN